MKNRLEIPSFDDIQHASLEDRQILLARQLASERLYYEWRKLIDPQPYAYKFLMNLNRTYFNEGNSTHEVVDLLWENNKDGTAIVEVPDINSSDEGIMTVSNLVTRNGFLVHSRYFPFTTLFTDVEDQDGWVKSSFLAVTPTQQAAQLYGELLWDDVVADYQQAFSFL